MKIKRFGTESGRRTLAVVFDKGEEAAAGLLRLAQEDGIRAASLQGIGGFREVTLGYFDRAARAYERIHVREQVEVLCLLGNLSMVAGGGPKAHVHVVIGKSDGSALGGHLLEGHVWPTLELLVTELPGTLERTLDEETGLPLLDPGR